jgi:tetratricopeptide (TPR) repeat protein
LLTKSLLIAASIVLLLSILILQLPLLNYLGFEFSVAVALFMPWVVAGLVFKASRIPQQESIRDYRRTIRIVLARCLILLTIPFAVASLNAFLVRNCTLGEGALFYLLIPVVTAVWSVGFAVLCTMAFRRRGLSVYIIGCLLVVLAYPLTLGYFSPQIYSYNFIYGFFPGISYDETLTVTTSLLLFRLVTVLLALLFFLLAEFLVRQGVRGGGNPLLAALKSLLVRPDGLKTSILLLSALMLSVWLFRAPLGFETSAGYIRTTLGSTYATEHFRIYYSSKSFSPDEIRYVGAMHEFRYAQVESALAVKFPRTISSYIYPDNDTKLLLIGTSTTNIAKPWRSEIHLSLDAWEGTLRHELVHVLAGEFGMPVIRAHYHIGIVEGLATAIDGGFGNRTANEYAGAVVKKFRLIANPGKLIQPLGFAMNASSVSYVLMGSFCRYLIDRYGIVRFKELYGGKSPQVVYGKAYDTLIEEWENVLDRVNVPDAWRSHVMFFFNRPSIFAKECARAIANMNEAAYRTLSRNNSVAAMRMFSEALAVSWNSDSYAGLVRASYNAARYDTVVRLVDTQLGDSLRRFRIVNLFLLYGDALWYRDDVLSARKAYEQVLALDLSDRFNESAALRLAATGERELRLSLPDYFTESITDSSALELFTKLQGHSGSPVLSYLKARIYTRQQQHRRAIDELEKISTRFGTPVLEAGREELLGENYFRLKQYQQARAHFWQALNFISNRASAERIDDRLQRCDWFEKNKN